MRIAITVDPEIPVPPKLYGGIERIVDMLVRGLLERGHDVTLFANPESQVSCRPVALPAIAESKQDRHAWPTCVHVSKAIHRGHFDLVHSFARLAYLTPLLPRRIPKIMSYQREVSPRSVRLGNLLSGGTLSFTGCSAHLIRRWQSNDRFHVVYNGVPLESYRATERVSGDAPLTYLGRVEEIKGVHLAIEVAREAAGAWSLPATFPRRSIIGVISQNRSNLMSMETLWNTSARWMMPPRTNCWDDRLPCSCLLVGRAVWHCDGGSAGLRNSRNRLAARIPARNRPARRQRVRVRLRRRDGRG